jgi:hypothetical protein
MEQVDEVESVYDKDLRLPAEVTWFHLLNLLNLLNFLKIAGRDG